MGMKPFSLTCDLNGDDGPNFAHNSENCHSVVTASYTDNSPILDGFTLTGGNGDQPDAQGGGMQVTFTTLTLSHLIITGNHADNGGGLAIIGNQPYLANLLISANTAAHSGGGILMSGSSPWIQAVTVAGNSALNGAGMDITTGAPLITDSLFEGNQATANGGGVHVTSASPTEVNVTMNGNTAATGGGWYATGGGTTILINDLFYGDTPGEVVADQSSGGTALITSYSLIQGCKPGGTWATATCKTDNGNNLTDADPRFANPAGGNWTLGSASPAIDKGNTLAADNFQMATDLGGNPRVQNTLIDLGAYEYFNQAPVIADFSKTTKTGQPVYFSTYDFVTHYSDANGDSLASVTIASLPAHGSLAFNHTAVTAGQVIPGGSVEDLAFTPDPQWQGTTSFTWNASDGALLAATPRTITLTVTGYTAYLPRLHR